MVSACPGDAETTDAPDTVASTGPHREPFGSFKAEAEARTTPIS
jgi:hypothetical protein